MNLEVMNKIKTKAFTLAEILITLAIIGVVAAIMIPVTIVNSQQQEFKTGLSKAVTSLNQALMVELAIDGQTPYDTANLFNYLSTTMNVIKTTTSLKYGARDNFAFYTADGIRYEVPYDKDVLLDLYETDGVQAYGNNGGCGAYGLDNNKNATVRPPCIILVDVNGDRKPNPANTDQIGVEYKYSMPTDYLVKDVFSILISDEAAIPYGVVGQKTMYKARKNEGTSK